MDTLISRSDGRADGEEWTENYERLPGGAGVSLILESTTQEGVGPRGGYEAVHIHANDHFVTDWLE